MVKNIINISGGKDSTALLLWAMERGIEFIPVFADPLVQDLPGRKAV